MIGEMFARILGPRATRVRQSRRRRHTSRPYLEALDGRILPDGGFATVLTTQHVDVGIAYEEDAWDLHLHNEDDDVEYAPDEALLFVGPSARTTQPADPRFAFLGAGAGNPVWVLPATVTPGLVLLGIGTEEIEDGTFLGDQVTLTLKAVRGPGHFSVWQTDSFGNPVVAMTSSDGISPADQSVRPTGGHADYNWGFTAPGCYAVDFEATARLADGESTASGVMTYYFGVETADCAPTEYLRVDRVVVNDGSAQRSMVTSLTVEFTGVAALLPGAFELTGPDGPVDLRVQTSQAGGRTVAVLTFVGPEIVGRSLADGDYALTVHADRVTDEAGRWLDGDDSGSAGGDYADELTRLYGDDDGDGAVGLADLFAFLGTFRKSAGDPEFRAHFDANGDGDVDVRDLQSFILRFRLH